MSSPDCKLLAFKIPVKGVAYSGTINHLNNSVQMILPAGASMDGLTAIVVVSPGATSSPKNGSTVSLSTPLSIKITAEDGKTTAVYTVFTKIREEKKVAQKEHQFRQMGWNNVICVTGSLESYTSGGISLNVRSISPRCVIGVQIDKGYTGFYDLETQKLKVYKGVNEEATADETVRYSVLLMGE